MSTDSTTDTAAGGSVISLPKGGGSVGGMGETFAPDPFTGSGVFSVPIAVPAGRRGFGPQVTLAYSTGNGNGPFGLGWRLSLPDVTRRTSRGVPRYAGADADEPDGFLLSGVEDLVAVAGTGDRVRYRPRTEGLFARIEHVTGTAGDFWEVRGRDGLLTRYGTPRPADAPADWRDPAAVVDPRDPGRVFGWRVSGTTDPLGNVIRYEYRRDQGQDGTRVWDQPLVSRISYVDHGDRAAPGFLVTVEFDYEPRPDPFSDHRAGFELRTSLRCRAIRVVTHAVNEAARTSREYRLTYTQASFNGVSLLTRVEALGIDESLILDDGPDLPPGDEESLGADADSAAGTEAGAGVEIGVERMPPIGFEYTDFDPSGRRFAPVTGAGLPATPLSDPTVALVDLRGMGLPDVVELGTTARFWRNVGDGRFGLPRQLADAPTVSLNSPDVMFMDADGDGRADLVTLGTGTGGAAGYFPMSFSGGWSRRALRPYPQVPGVHPADPGVALVDLDGDGLTDVLRTGANPAAWFNHPDRRRAWQRSVIGHSSTPPVDLADPRVRLADMTGDGLTDIVLVRNGNVGYWPNLGHGRWGGLVTMRRSPRLPDGFDPARVLLGDVDGDGAADLVYVDDGRTLVWGNRSGNEWSAQPVTITGTPRVSDTDQVRLADLRGTGMGGVLFSRTPDGTGRPRLFFLDLTGGEKPYLLSMMDNHLGAVTRIRYQPSTVDFLRDEADPATRWRTTLPFPVQVVSRVEVEDAISTGRLVTEYRYRHGYWDGVEREFRGFGLVEQRDTETLPGPVPDGTSPPTLTRRWFHLGPVAAGETDDWTELDLSHEYWDGDAPMLSRSPQQVAFLAGLGRDDRRSALRALRGQLLRSELYAVDGTDREDRPYTVTETQAAVRAQAPRVFFPFPVGQRSTQWERGDDPMTRFTFPAGHDDFGFPARELGVAVPRGRDPRVADPGATGPYLATISRTEYARRDDPELYLVDRVCRTSAHEVVNDGRLSIVELRDAVLGAGGPGVELRLIGHTRTRYDGPAFVGLPVGTLGAHGLPVYTEQLAFTDAFLDQVFTDLRPHPVYLTPGEPVAWTPDYPPEFRTTLPELAGYAHYGPDEVPGSPGGYYRVTARHRYDTHAAGRVPRGLLLTSLDPLGAPSHTEYDPHDLLPVRSVDAAGLATEAVPDYRVLQPREVTDPNGTTVAVTYSPLGLVTTRSTRDKHGTGDRDRASLRTEYDLLAFVERGQPVSVRAIRRAYHDTDTTVPVERREDTVVSVDYYDGFGRLLQTRAHAGDTLFGDPTFGGKLIPLDQAEPGAAVVGRTRAAADPDNVVVSGAQVYDNKGRVVHRYEPYFARGFAFTAPTEAQLGQRVTLRYDPRGQLLRTVNPDGSQTRIVPGVPVDLADPDRYLPTPWELYTYDQNDNAGRTHPQAGEAYRAHWDTPSSVEVDALGRVVRGVARNGAPERADTDWFTTRQRYDIQGNLLAITDPLGREAFRYTFDLLRRRWRMDGIDSGRRTTVLDAVDHPVESRDDRDAVILGGFDRLRRQTHVWARDDRTGPVTLRQHIEYGDAGTPDQPAADRAAARARNLLGRTVRHRDEAGLLTVDEVDFKGNVRESTRQMIADGPILATYETAASAGWRVAPLRVDWTPGAGQTRADRDAELLEPKGYRTSTRFDALNRVAHHLFPPDVEDRRRALEPRYDRAGRLVELRLDGVVQIGQVSYDATGQRTLIAYGNGVMTRYAYEPATFRLARLRTERFRSEGPALQPLDPPIQDYGYRYDLTGNVLAISDQAPGSGIRDNPDAARVTDARLRGLLSGGDALVRTFSYDPTYRLLSASGREHGAPPPGAPWVDLPRGTDPAGAQSYLEGYTYDPAGNLLGVSHLAPGGFTRQYTLEPGTNRLRGMTVDTAAFDHTFDANGNLVDEAGARHFTWNHADQLSTFSAGAAGAEPSLHAHYLYDATGQRVKKLVRRQGGAVEVTHYLAEVFEHLRWNGPAGGANNRVHVMDGDRRVSSTRIGPAHPGDAGPAVAFHLDDHLGSGTALVDRAGAVLNREEFTPYGETSFGGQTRKRYRFTGQERDEESGLNYHSARYLAPWLGRWTSCDPIGPGGGLNVYAYVSGNPVRLVDPTGLDFWDRVWGGVKTVVGGLETAAGVAITTAGAAASSLGVGIPIAALGVAVTAHGVDTMVSGARTVYAGAPVDTFTSQGLQAAGVSRDKANLIDAGIGVVGTLGAAAAVRAPAAAVELVHLTNPQSAAAITSSLTLGRGASTLYLGPSSLATRSTLGVALRTGVSPSSLGAVVSVPNAAAGAFRVPAVVGPFSAWQRLSGTVYSTGAGSLNLSTGLFTRTGIGWNQLTIYSFDAVVNFGLRLPSTDATSDPADTVGANGPDPTPAPVRPMATPSPLMRMRETSSTTRNKPFLSITKTVSGD